MAKNFDSTIFPNQQSVWMSFSAVMLFPQSNLVETLFQLLHNVHHAILFVVQQVAYMLISEPPSNHKILDAGVCRDWWEKVVLKQLSEGQWKEKFRMSCRPFKKWCAMMERSTLPGSYSEKSSGTRKTSTSMHCLHVRRMHSSTGKCYIWKTPDSKNPTGICCLHDLNQIINTVIFWNDRGMLVCM